MSERSDIRRRNGRIEVWDGDRWQDAAWDGFDFDKWLTACDREVRAAALEEAAQACVGSGAIVAEARLCASAIRALKKQ